MDRTATSEGDATAGQSKKVQQRLPHSSSGSESESGRSDREHEQQQPTPPRQARPAEQHHQSHEQHQQHQQHSQQTQQNPQNPHDQPQQPHKPTSSTGAPHTRAKTQKHVVSGGGTTARLHARVPSSKALHKALNHHHHHAPTTTSSAKQQQLQQSHHHRRRSSTSPSPSYSAARFPVEQTSHQQPQTPRRSTSTTEAKLQRNANSSSASSLVRRNVSATSLKRNRSHADVAKRMSHGPARPTANIKRTNSNPANSHSAFRDRSRPQSSAGKKPNTQVHFEIGSPDAQEDEWVDAGSSNVSGSRKNSLQHKEVDLHGVAAQLKGDKPNEDEEEKEEVDTTQKEAESPTRTASDSNGSQSPPQHPAESSEGAEVPQPSSYASTSTSHRRTGSTTRLLLPRTPPRGAPPKMSTETASATRNMQSSSPDSSPTRRLQHRHQQSLPGGSGEREAMTSRFITTGSHESVSATTGGGSYYTTSSSRPSTGRHPIDDRDNTSASNGVSASSTSAPTRSHPRRARSIGGETMQLTDEEDSGLMISGEGRKSGAAGGTHPRRTRAPHAPPAELSRTQQKLNLERASSSIDRSSRQHKGPATGSLLGSGEFGMHDPRIGKLMDKTGMEYYVVRRYQNPVTRSLGRLTDRLGGDRNWRIPAANGGSRTSTGLSDTNGPVPGHAATRSVGSGLSQSFRERDIRRGALQSATAAAASGSGTNTLAGPSRPKSYAANGSGGGASGEPSAAYQQHQQRLSGASLVDGYDEDSTAALLRNLWDKNLYLGTSQD